MLEVKFYDTVDDSLLKFAVIISQSNGKMSMKNAMPNLRQGMKSQKLSMMTSPSR